MNCAMVLPMCIWHKIKYNFLDTTSNRLSAVVQNDGGDDEISDNDLNDLITIANVF